MMGTAPGPGCDRLKALSSFPIFLKAQPCNNDTINYVCRWFPPLFREGYSPRSLVSPLLKNQHFQIQIRSGLVKCIITILLNCDTFSFIYLFIL